MYGLQGLLAFLILVVTLVSIVAGLGYKALVVQQENATNYYQAER
ncbi:MAG: DUF4006 family protein [SAR324 cluster bacterium]|nr:DUF4006 family protein [SAR324 cluster bacterium]MBL7034797.1 DUF4006 family protein [SAR324 cluster bacterium]